MGVWTEQGTSGHQSALPPLNLGTSAQIISKEEGFGLSFWVFSFLHLGMTTTCERKG